MMSCLTDAVPRKTWYQGELVTFNAKDQPFVQTIAIEGKYAIIRQRRKGEGGLINSFGFRKDSDQYFVIEAEIGSASEAEQRRREAA